MSLQNPLEFARQLVDELAARGASDLLLLDLRGLTVIADCFVIGTVHSSPQMRAIRQVMDGELTSKAEIHPRFEGDYGDGWLLADFGTVVVHVFSEQGRAYYRLEELWADAPAVLRVQ